MKGSGDILMRYLKVTQHMSRLFREHFGRLHLTFPQALVLTVLGEEGPMPISALAERTGSANSTVSGIVDRLEKDRDRRGGILFLCDGYPDGEGKGPDHRGAVSPG